MSRIIVALPGLSERLASKAGIEQAVAEAFIITYFDFITRGLTVSESVSIKDFGTFTRTNDAACPVTFIPDSKFEHDVNRPFAIFQPVVIDASLDADDVITGNETITDGNEIPVAPASTAEQERLTEPAPLPEPELQISAPESAPESNEAESVPEHTESIAESTDTEHPIEDADDENSEQIIENNVEDPATRPTDDETDYADSSYNESVTGISQRRHMTVSMLMLTVGLIIGAVFGYFLNDYLQVVKIKVERSAAAEVVATDSVTASDITLNAASDTANAAVKADSALTATKPVTKEPEPVVTDTITSQRFLTTMARKYYGHMEYWSFIYEANSDRLDHPNRIKPGTVVNIPSLKSITARDSNKTQTMERARRTGAAIYAKFD